MGDSCMLSHVTQDYLRRYQEILDTMICGMTRGEATDSISRDFIVRMIPHHEAAIQMSENLLRFTTCIPLQEITEHIIRSQTESIRNMENALCVCRQLKNPPRQLTDYQRQFEQITGVMFSKMQHARVCNDINISFLYEMIPHHEGAVRMSENALCFGICPELVPILQAILVSQREGIQRMKQLQRCLLEEKRR